MNPDYSYKPEGHTLPKLAIFYKAIHMLSFFLFLGFANPAVGQALDAAALLKQLKSLDSVYEAAFTASGSYLFVASFFPPNLPPLRKKWHLTMSNGKIAYEEEVIEVLKWEDVLSPNQDIPERRQTGSLRSRGEPMTALRTTYFFGPTAQSMYDFVGKIPPYGLLPPWPENSPGLATSGSLAFDDPDTGAYRFDIKRTLWSLGRGYSAHITNIKDVAKQEDGLISVIAEANDISSRQGAKWELVIDPSAAYMVRSAELYRMYRRGTYQPQPTISIVNSGVKWYGSRCVPEKTEWKDSYAGGRSISNEFHSASSEADMEFLKHAEGTMRRPYLVHTDVHDLRMTPELIVQYRAGELMPKSAGVARTAKPKGKPISLVGKPLPELKDIGIDISSVDVNDKMILVCVFDYEQRPSRNCIIQLSKKVKALKAKDIIILTVQASKVEQAKLDEWIKDNNIPFPVGMIQDDVEKTHFTWGVKTLPWLILTDKEHIVRAEGFGINELDKKITALIEK